MSVVTKPIALDETAQTMNAKLQAIADKLTPNAGGVSYSNATSGLSAETVQEAIDEVDGNVDNLSSSLTKLNYPAKKATGTSFAGTFMCMGAQIDASRIAIAVPFPFICENTNYTVNITSCTLIGITVLSPSDVSVDSKQTTGMRLMATYSGTAKQAYMCQVGMTLTY